jgi:hypothetical protein
MTLKELFVKGTAVAVAFGIGVELAAAVSPEDERKPPADMQRTEEHGGSPHNEQEPVQQPWSINYGITPMNTTAAPGGFPFSGPRQSWYEPATSLEGYQIFLQTRPVTQAPEFPFTGPDLHGQQHGVLSHFPGALERLGKDKDEVR